MALATRLPLAAENKFFYWANIPILVVGLSADPLDNTIYWSTPPTDETGTIITGAFLSSWTNKSGKTEVIWIPANAVAVDGLSASGVVRGINPKGLDYTVGNVNFILQLDGGSTGNCVIAAQDGELFRAAIQGLIATGANSFLLGTDAVGMVTLYRSIGIGTKSGYLRWNNGNGKTEYSNDGITWNTFDSVSGSDLLIVTNSDTTPGALYDKTASGSAITRTVLNPGGNEILQISTVLPAIVSSHAVYIPAYLTGDTGAQSGFGFWGAVTDGSFKISIDGAAYNLTGISFLGVVSMAAVAAVIQIKIRAATGHLETVIWATDHFIITSANTTSSSAVSVTSTISVGVVGTDISGAGASDWMDCDAGNGVATPAVKNPSADSGKLVSLDASGLFPTEFVDAIPATLLDAKGDLVTATADNTPAKLVVGSDGQTLVADSTDPKGIKWGNTPLSSGNFNNGKTTQLNNVASGTVQNIAHGLGKAPASVDIFATTVAVGVAFSYSNGSWKTGTQNSAGIYINVNAGTGFTISNGSTIYLVDGIGGTIAAAVTVDATNIILTWTKVAGGAGTGANIEIQWKVAG